MTADFYFAAARLLKQYKGLRYSFLTASELMDLPEDALMATLYQYRTEKGDYQTLSFGDVVVAMFLDGSLRCMSLSDASWSNLHTVGDDTTSLRLAASIRNHMAYLPNDTLDFSLYAH
jgi:hypothetical protein